MGHVVHHAIVITSWDEKPLMQVYQTCANVGAQVTEIVRSRMNGYSTFVVTPDGSKSGWDEDAVGDAQREAIIAVCRKQRYEDGSSPLEWVEVSYGNDDNEAQVVHHEWDDWKHGGK